MSADKPGRNDPCYCGSGKKYKKCCLGLETSSSMAEVTDFGWRKLRQIEGLVFDQHLIPYITQEMPDGIIKFAVSDCLPNDLPEALDRELLFTHFFLPWVLFNWFPNDDSGLEQFDPERTLSQDYIRAHGEALNCQAKRFIDDMNQTYYSFYSVQQVQLNKSLLVKDILLGMTHTIKERQGTHQLKRGDVIFSRILTQDNQSIFVGMAPFIIPASYHHDLIDYKAWLVDENDDEPLTPNVLRYSFNVELLDYYFNVLKAAYDSPLPTLVNNDGELLQFSKTHFKLTATPEETLKRLLPLTFSDNEEEFLQNAKRTPSGDFECVEFPWLKKEGKKHSNCNNAVLGHISIEQGRLILETNSEERTKKGKNLIKKHLGGLISFQQTLIQSVEQKLQSMPPPSDDDKNESEDLMALPEVQSQLQAIAKSHWESWFDTPIPALSDQTPRQAAKTENGRERLEALLLQYECNDTEKGDHPFKADINYLKSELELD